MHVCLRSWNRHWTPATLRAEVHATFQEVMGVVGSVPYTCEISGFPLNPTLSLGNT